MTLQTALAAASTLLALAFTLVLLERWLARRRPQEGAWAASLAMFTAASGALFVGAGLGWGEASFRAFFLFGAIVNVPYLALGTVYLLAGRRAGDRTRDVIVVASAFAAGVLVVAPLHAPVPAGELPRGADVFGPLPRVLAAVASGGGALVVFAGAVWSAWRVLRGGARPGAGGRPVARGRVAAGNGLIALGVLVLSGGGLLNSVLGEMEAFAVSLVVGVVLLFAGFLVASSSPPGGAGDRPRA